MYSVILSLLLLAGTIALPDVDGPLEERPDSNSSDVSTYLTNGTPKYVPSYVRLTLNGKTPRSVCGGTLISKRHVLTAARCLVGAKQVTVAVASKSIGSEGPSYPVGLDKLYLYPKVTSSLEVKTSYSRMNDIAIIELPSDVPSIGTNGYLVTPARLPTDSIDYAKTFEYKLGKIAGYGRTEFDVPTQQLLTGKVMMTSRWQCQSMWMRSKYVLCSVPAESTGCFADEGGPLFVKEGDGRNTLIGVSNKIFFKPFSDVSCSNGFMNGYAYVREYLPWIRRVVF